MIGFVFSKEGFVLLTDFSVCNFSSLLLPQLIVNPHIFKPWLAREKDDMQLFLFIFLLLFFFLVFLL